MKFKRFAGGVAFAAMSAALTPVAVAQVTTSAVNGTVSKADGTPASDATVLVQDTRTGLSRSVITTQSGAFDVRGLNVGGPYTVTVSAPGQQTTQVTDVVLNLGAPTSLNLTFTGAESTNVVIVTASQAASAPVAIGPSTSFSLADLQNKPAINRDLKDVVKLDPRIYIDEMAGGTAGNDGIQCAGASPRFNSLTVDGIGLNDGFGLNNNGYPTEKMPFPYDAIANVSVELAPFDVQYTGFTGCNINAVTKSGTNEFHGSIFYDFTNQDMRGDESAGVKFTVPDFEDKRIGGTIGGPIIPDTLFFFGAYEKSEGVKLFSRGPIGSGAANQVPGLTQAVYDEIVDIATNVYGITDLGGTPTSTAIADEKYLLRLDANITDQHRASLTYNYNESKVPTEANTGNTNFEFGQHLYYRGAELKALSGQLFSNWTDNFTTEIKLAQNDVDFEQRCLQGATLADVQIRLGGSSVYLGCDFSRQANDLNYTVLNGKALGRLSMDDHTLTFGAEVLKFDIFNLFAQGAEGSYVFNTVNDFRNGVVANGLATYRNARVSNNKNDLGAQFAYNINSVYVQDEFLLGDSADITLGLRYDWYTGSDTPRANANFLARNGFLNTENLDGKGILQPRFGFNWDVMDNLSLRGGVGLYAGGNPNVWISNAYSNDGITQIQLNSQTIPNILTNPNSADDRGPGQTVNPNGALWGIPTTLYNQIANASAPNSTVNAIDPDFEPAAEWKFALGATYDADFSMLGLGDDYTIMLDFLRSQTKNASQVVNGTLRRVGTAPDGVSPIYKRVNPLDPDCVGAGTATTACSTGSIDDLILKNVGDGGFSNVYSIGISKSYDDLGLDWSFAYAHVDAEDTRSLSSSTANSNFGSTAVTDILNPSRATGNFEIPNRFTMSVGYELELFPEFTTRINLTGQAYQSRNWSYSFRNGGLDTGAGGAFGDFNEGVHLLYVPTGPTDPNVLFCGGAAQANPLCLTAAGSGQYVTFDTTSFFNWADGIGLSRGSVDERNSHEGTWTNKFDLKVTQEFPTGVGKGEVFFVLENLGNLIDSDWGVPYETPFPQREAPVEVDRDPVTNRFVFRRLFDATAEEPVRDVGFWTVRVGAGWQF